MATAQLGATYTEALSNGASSLSVGAVYVEAAATSGAPSLSVGAQYIEVLAPSTSTAFAGWGIPL